MYIPIVMINSLVYGYSDVAEDNWIMPRYNTSYFHANTIFFFFFFFFEGGGRLERAPIIRYSRGYQVQYIGVISHTIVAFLLPYDLVLFNLIHSLKDGFAVMRQSYGRHNVTEETHTYVRTYIHTYIHTCIHTYMFVVVNFDALAQASDIWIERRQVVFLCRMQDSNPRSQTTIRQQTECLLTNRLSYRGSS